MSLLWCTAGNTPSLVPHCSVRVRRVPCHDHNAIRRTKTMNPSSITHCCAGKRALADEWSSSARLSSIRAKNKPDDYRVQRTRDPRSRSSIQIRTLASAAAALLLHLVTPTGGKFGLTEDRLVKLVKFVNHSTTLPRGVVLL